MYIFVQLGPCLGLYLNLNMGYDSGHDLGHNLGHNSGPDSDHNSGHDSGHDSGHNSDYDLGHDSGLNSGHDLSHDSGLDWRLFAAWGLTACKPRLRLGRLDLGAWTWVLGLVPGLELCLVGFWEVFARISLKDHMSRNTNIQFCWLKLVPNDFSLVVTKTIIMVITS